MTSNVWNQVLSIAEKVENKIQQYGSALPPVDSEYNWYNSLYTGDLYRKAHVEMVDKRDSHKILILHCTIFPHYDNPGPIWGFDAVCGANKITGAFHDLSSGGDPNNTIIQWFSRRSAELSWNKRRELPTWASDIFSPYIIAAGNVSDQQELAALENLVLESLDYYLSHLPESREPGSDYWSVQSRYNKNNKLNPHVVKSMVSMGVPESTMKRFIDEVLYPEDR